MSADVGARDALFRDPLPEGFSRRVFRVAPGLEVALEPGCLPDAIVVVEQGELELECRGDLPALRARLDVPDRIASGIPPPQRRPRPTRPRRRLASAAASDR